MILVEVFEESKLFGLMAIWRFGMRALFGVADASLLLPVNRTAVTSVETL